MRRLQSKRLITAILSVVAMLYTKAISFAETEPGQGLPTSEFPTTDSFNSFGMIVKVIFFLVLIILLFFVLIKYIAKKNKGMMFGNSIRSLGGVPLGQNKSIQIVEIGHSLFVVGVGENIQLLDKINDADEVAYISELLTSSQDDRVGFGAISNWISKLSVRKKEIEEEVEITSSFQQVFHDRLQRVSNRNKDAHEWLSDQKQTDRLNDE
ncbi:MULTISPECIES: flagellar biosynthetic protein FliO [unclassified Paenibacillus]|uniref:flagellar biosynthetic protein FliO n=1 Tax=unclassified Paenibacillus TaxID=185978 RepID=UPI00278B3557|nr:MULTISPECIES: flagellar biosynthetic protein FliO [unclassified Paenibacillus]MDQ0899803.1 flagellar protein FliO/FliZ [Paenibacillus sp. V4I7]MDQ0914242.1 flagellar protein FliO/FliZ [Paenibacillus sp. V4I5]